MIVALDLTGADVLVIGGGTVATRRGCAAAAAGARLEVVAPRVTSRLQAAVDESGGRCHLRVARTHDFDRRWALVIVAVDDPHANVVLTRAAGQRALLWSSAHGGGAVRHLATRGVGDMRVAVDSEGRDPAAAVAVVEHLAAVADDLMREAEES